MDKPSTKPESSFVQGRAVSVGEVIAKKGQGTRAKAKPGRAPTPRMMKAAQLVVENGRKPKPDSKGKILKEAGYSQAIQNQPHKVLDTPAFQDLLNDFIPDTDLATVHKRLLHTRKIEHMVFPLGQQDEDDPNLSGANPNQYNQMDDLQYPVERTNLSDQEIKDMLLEVNCTVKRIVHGQTARHVYFWAHDANAQTKALELAYKMKGHLNKGDGDTGKSPFNFNVFQGGQSFVTRGDE